MLDNNEHQWARCRPRHLLLAVAACSLFATRAIAGEASPDAPSGAGEPSAGVARDDAVSSGTIDAREEGSDESTPAPSEAPDAAPASSEAPDAAPASSEAPDAAPASSTWDPDGTARSRIPVNDPWALTRREAHLPQPNPLVTPCLPCGTGRSPELPELPELPEHDEAASRAAGRGSAAAAYKLAAGVDFGIPEGVMTSAIYRAVPWLRLQAGVGTNCIAHGFRGGLTLAPFGTGPSLTLQAGHYAEGDANPLVGFFAGFGYVETPVLRRIGYSFASARLGFEVRRRRLTLFAQGGVSYLRGKLHRVDEVLANATAEGGDSGITVTLGKEPSFKAWVPSVDIGLLIDVL